MFKIVKGRTATREYKDKAIPKAILDKIITSGIWGPSIHNFQPWQFIVIIDKKLMNKILTAFLKCSKMIQLPSFFLLPTIKAISSAQVMICIYNNQVFTNFIDVIFPNDIKDKYSEIAKITELSSIAATIQNMIIVAESLGVGSCWLDSILFCEEKINAFLGTKQKLIALLTLGYPNKKGRRAKRRCISKVVRYR